jgi:site-specific recombinase XerD
MEIAKKDEKNIEELVNNFIFSLYSKSEHTQKTYAFALEMNQIERITLEHIERYIISLKNKYKPSSVNLTINAIKSFYNYLAENGHPNIGRLIKTVPALPSEQRVLTRPEYDSICARVHEPHKLDCFRCKCDYSKFHRRKIRRGLK